MSKSKGEFLTVSLLEQKGYNPLAYRLFCLQSHYRKQLVFTYDALDNASNAYEKLKNKIKSLKENIDGEIDNTLVNEYQNKFKQTLEDDLNTADALTILYEVLKLEANNKTKLYLIEDFDNVLSLDLLKEEEIDSETLEYISKKIEERNIAKKNKDYALADAIREELKNKGIFIKDTREGTTFEIK